MRLANSRVIDINTLCDTTEPSRADYDSNYYTQPSGRYVVMWPRVHIFRDATGRRHGANQIGNRSFRFFIGRIARCVVCRD